MTFVHVSIRASDIERSLQFYKDILGMVMDRRRKIPKNRAEIAFLKDPDRNMNKCHGTSWIVSLKWFFRLL
jgi:catechol 2,3-dioxygenase-like lactoylglutathione lyase family enzyme